MSSNVEEVRSALPELGAPGVIRDAKRRDILFSQERMGWWNSKL
jgi:hypothetical protein